MTSSRSFHSTRSTVDSLTAKVLSSSAYSSFSLGQLFAHWVTQRPQVGPVWGRTVEGGWPSRWLDSFISVIWEYNTDSIGPNKRYVLILFSVCLSRQRRLSMDIRNAYHKSEEDGHSGRPEGVALLVRFLSLYSFFVKKEKKLKPHHPLIRWSETIVVKMCCRQKFWKIPESIENISKQGIFLLYLSC